MKIVSIFACILLMFSGCSFIAKKGYGAKKPKVENDISISQWLGKHHLGNQRVVTIQPEYYYNFFPAYSQAPMLFDRKTGNYVAAGLSNGKFCPKDLDLLLATIVPYFLLSPKPDNFIITEISVKSNDSVQILKDTATLNLSGFCTGMSDLTGKTFSVSNLESNDYVLFLPFALFLGNRLQVQDIKKYYRAAQSNKRSKIQVVFVNLDKQKWWGDEWNKKINL